MIHIHDDNKKGSFPN